MCSREKMPKLSLWLMNDDAPAAKHRCRVVVVWGVELVVVHQAAAVAPDSDPELVLPVAVRLLPVNDREHKPVAALAVYCAEAFVLRLLPSYDQPLVARTLEVETRCLELKLSIAGRDARAVLILGDKAEVRLACTLQGEVVVPNLAG
jgi:hypothetical protein